MVYLGRNPLPRVYRSVEIYSWLGSFATTTPEMDTKDRATLERGTGCYQLRVVGKGHLQVTKEPFVIRICMVRVEPREAWDRLDFDNCKLFSLGTST
jgi:hypothetical protein